MKELEYFLTHIVGLKAAYASQLQEHLVSRSLKKKEPLIAEGTVCHFIGFVITGALRSFLTSNGEEFNNDFYFDGDIASAYSSFLTGEPTNCNIEALTVTDIQLLTAERYRALVDTDTEWLKLGKYVSDSYFIRKCRRESSFLRQTASERLENLQRLYPGIEQKVSQYHIASYLGIKPESLSRIKLLTYINK